MFAVLLLLVRGLPTWLACRGEPAPAERGALGEADAVALMGAGMLSLVLLPIVGIALAARRG
jgi:hypothetical protein